LNWEENNKEAAMKKQCKAIMKQTAIGAAECLIMFFCIVSPQVFAQDEAESLSLAELLNIKIEVSSLKADTVFNTPSTVSVIDRDMIRRYNFRTISEALMTAAGFAVYPTYYKRNLPTSRGILQDQYANKILYLINGIPSWNPVSGAANIDRIDIHSVERIEILKGPASVLYGSNAYSGTVNVVLRTSAKENGEFHIGTGDGTAFLTGGYYTGRIHDLQIFAAACVYDEAGKDYEWTDHGGTAGSFSPSHDTKNATLHLKYKGHALLFNAASSSEAFFGAGPEWRYGAGNSHDEDGYLFNYTFSKRLREKIRLMTGLTYDWHETDFSRSADDILRNMWNGTRINGFAKSDIRISDSFSFEIGADYETRKCRDSRTYNKQTGDTEVEIGLAGKSVYEYSAFSELEYKWDAATILLGTRMTKNEFFGTDFSSRGTFVWTLNEKNSIKLIAGQSFRAPSIFEIHVNDGRIVGNKELKPEKSDSFEIAYLTSFGNFFIQALGYYAEYENKIRRISRENILTYTNGSNFRAKGLELELKYENPRVVSGFINYSYIEGNDGDDDGTDNYNFKYIPRQFLSAGFSKSIGKFNISGVLNYWTETEGSAGELGDQYSADLNISYSHKMFSKKIHHALSFKNLSDSDAAFPEYIRRYDDLNEISTEFGYGRRIFYTMAVNF
jgi:outer membrane receptor protein involved in Fe transport